VASQSFSAEMEAFVAEWVRSMAQKDAAAAAALRADEYRLSLSGADALDKRQELALIADADHRFASVAVEDVEGQERGPDAAQATARIRVKGEFGGTRIDSLYRYTFQCRREAGRWVAVHAETEELADYREPEAAEIPQRPLLRRIAGRAARAVGLRRNATAVPKPKFQDLAYIPYDAGSDYVLAPHAPTAAADEALPVPPEELWLGYHYLAHGENHVRTMLDIVKKTGFAPSAGDRILDLGCGGGRMIRHLRDLAGRCEIWGADISAAHISWCKHNLSPPFHFATTTKVPHLPFEDRSFAFIYCGSLFTHIDDLADSWLLELKRILRPDGRLYVTIHDEETIRLFDLPRYSHADIVKGIKRSETYQAARNSDFGMFTIGRDDGSQVFYRRSYFERMAGQAFETLSITPEAYHYQTAFVLARKDRPAQ
jgi:ubiquinone/menaquinone biosynthesis C-methylase UbiE/ketosteroid isomerase-like protein